MTGREAAEEQEADERRRLRRITAESQAEYHENQAIQAEMVADNCWKCGLSQAVCQWLFIYLGFDS